MKLQVFKRTASKKTDTKKIRREGNIPAAMYVRGENADNITLKNADFQAVLRSIQPGRLPTTIFTLVDEHGKERKAIIKDIQYEATTYNVQHLDFEELYNDKKVNVKVPIECTGVVDCVGIKLGGFLRQVIRQLRVSCFPKDIPSALQVDIRNLALFESKRLCDLEIPQTVRPLVDLKEVAIVIAKR